MQWGWKNCLSDFPDNFTLSKIDLIFLKTIFLLENVWFASYFCLLVFSILVAWFSLRFFRLAHLVLQNINKDYIIFSYFHDQKTKMKNGVSIFMLYKYWYSTTEVMLNTYLLCTDLLKKARQLGQTCPP